MALRVLICDDSLVSCQLLSSLCARLCLCRCDVVEEGADAVARCSATRYDLVLLDELDAIGLFGLSGLETAARIRSLPVPLSCARIVLMTPRPFSELSLPALFSSGIDGLLQKPWSERAVERILSGDRDTRLFHFC